MVRRTKKISIPKKMGRPRRTTPAAYLMVRLEPEDEENLRNMAFWLGFIINSSSKTGGGNVSAMMRAIAKLNPSDLVPLLFKPEAD